MLPRNALINLLYRYKLVKQAALDDHIKEAYSKQLQYRDEIQKLINLYKVDSLVKEASLSNDLYEQAVLMKLAARKEQEKPMTSFQKLANLWKELKDAILTATNAPPTATGGSGIPVDLSPPGPLVRYEPPGELARIESKPTGLAPIGPETTKDLVHARSTDSSRLSRLKQLLSTISSKIKSNKQGLIGGGIGLLSGLGAGLLSGRSSDSAYDKGKADALKNMTEEDLKKAILALKGDEK